LVADIAELDPIWKALADPTRRAILDLLREKPRTTGDLTSAFEPRLSRFAVIKHIGVLEGAGLLVTSREGRYVWHHLNAVPLQEMYERWVRPYEALWASSLLDLRRHIDTPTPEEETSMDVVTIEQKIRMAAPPERVFKGLTEDVNAWWDHRYREGSTVSLEPHVGGRFQENFGDGGGALYATVSFIDPGRRLTMRGSMGMGGAVTGVIKYDLEPSGTGTVLRLSHHVVGEVSQEDRDEYAAGWTALLEGNLRSLVEAGANHD